MVGIENRVVQLDMPAEFKIVLNDYYNLASNMREPKMWIELKKPEGGYGVVGNERNAWVFTVDNILTEGYEAFSYLLRKYHTDITVSAKIELVSFIGRRADVSVVKKFWDKILLVLNELELHDNNGGII